MLKTPKIVLIGAGSLQFGLGTVGSILNSKILNQSTVVLHDINQENLDLAELACKAAIEKQESKVILEATTNRQLALAGANFIINSIEVTPRFELWEQDYDYPRELGNKQVMGENGGPGGLFHALRIVPPILDICNDIQKICPDALVINFSNPMSRICLAVARKFPKLKFIGLCHEIAFVQNIVPRILGTPIENLDVKAGGLNHFGIILDIKYRDSGKDAYPDLRAKGPAFFETYNELDGMALNQYIFKHYHYLPYTSDSHFGEYIGWAWDKADLEGVHNFKDTYKEMTLSEGRRIRRLIKKGKGARLVKPDDERAIPIIEGVITNSGQTEMSVNLPNTNTFTNLPQDLVVESPAIVDKDGVHAIPLGEFPKSLAALQRIQASVQDLVVEAILTKSKEVALHSLLADPVVESATQAEAILKRMLESQADYIHLE